MRIIKKLIYYFPTIISYFVGDLICGFSIFWYSINPECGEDSLWDKIGAKLFNWYSHFMHLSVKFDIKGGVNFWKE